MVEDDKFSPELISAIDTAKKKKYDAVCKVVMKDLTFISCLAKELIPECQEYTEEEIKSFIEIESISNSTPVSKNYTNAKTIAEEDSTVNEGLIKYDVLFNMHVPKKSTEKETLKETITVDLRVNIEAQNDLNPGYQLESRSIYYAARSLSSEFGGAVESADYKNLQKAYSIWICFNSPSKKKDTIQKYYVKKEDVLGSLDVPKNAYDLLEVVMIYIGKDTVFGKSKSINLIKSIFNNDDPEKIRSQMTTLGYSRSSLEKEAIGMKTFSDALIERIQSEDRENEQKRVILRNQKLVRNMILRGFSVEDISEIAELSIDDVKRYEKMGKEEV